MTGPGVTQEFNAQWARVRGLLRDEFGEAAFRSWLKPLTLVDIMDGEVKVSVPTRFMRDWIVTHYADRIHAIWKDENPDIGMVNVFVNDSGQPNEQFARSQPAQESVKAKKLSEKGAKAGGHNGSGSGTDAAADAKAGGNGKGNDSRFAQVASGAPEGSGEVSAPLDPRFTFSNFVVGKPNELAFAAARRVAEAEVVPFNPLFLYGGVGLGKTHLMHAIAHHIRERNPRRKVMYLSAEKFMYQFIRALRFRDTMAFKDEFRSVDVLMVDDVQFISDKETTQEEFFHTFNALVDQNRQIIISADKSPNDLEGIEDRMRSRLGWGLVADIHPTTYELRLGILQSKADRLNTEIPPKVLEFLAHKITSNVRELEGALNRIVAHATLVGWPISLESTQEALHDILRVSDRRVTIEQIQKRVAEHFNIKLVEMSSARRARDL